MEKLKTVSRPAPAQLTTHDDGQFVRTAVQLDGKTITSVDVLNPDGSLFCRLNLARFSSGDGTVDVILDPTKYRGAFLAWNRGATQVRTETVKGTTVHAVALTRI